MQIQIKPYIHVERAITTKYGHEKLLPRVPQRFKMIKKNDTIESTISFHKICDLNPEYNEQITAKQK